MSGTSLDGIDAVLVDFDSGQPVDCLATHYVEMPEPLRDELLTLCSPGDNEIERMGHADRLFAQTMAETVLALMDHAGTEQEQIVAIGSHGQTIRHCPDAALPFTLQIGDPNTLAELTGMPVVADFRRRDIAVDGQGAPMVPGFHRYCFGVPDKTRAIVNIGGFSNLSVLHASGEVSGFDCGTGSVLLDAWIRRCLGKSHDRDGAWARTGKPNAKLLSHLRQHPFFQRQPPRSTGREEFNLEWLQSRLDATSSKPLPDKNVQATLLEFTATSIAESLTELIGNTAVELFVCGGGALNSFLLERLQKNCPRCEVKTTNELGVPPEWVEAIAFAWLARQHVRGLPGNVPAATGARHERVLGTYCPGSNRQS